MTVGLLLGLSYLVGLCTVELSLGRVTLDLDRRNARRAVLRGVTLLTVFFSVGLFRRIGVQRWIMFLRFFTFSTS